MLQAGHLLEFTYTLDYAQCWLEKIDAIEKTVRNSHLIENLGALLFRYHKPGILENLQMMGNCRPRQVTPLGQSHDIQAVNTCIKNIKNTLLPDFITQGNKKWTAFMEHLMQFLQLILWNIHPAKYKFFVFFCQSVQTIKLLDVFFSKLLDLIKKTLY